MHRSSQPEDVAPASHYEKHLFPIYSDAIVPHVRLVLLQRMAEADSVLRSAEELEERRGTAIRLLRRGGGPEQVLDVTGGPAAYQVFLPLTASLGEYHIESS